MQAPVSNRESWPYEGQSGTCPACKPTRTTRLSNLCFQAPPPGPIEDSVLSTHSWGRTNSDTAKCDCYTQ